MNNIEKELKSYIKGAERMSNFDYNDADGDVSMFDAEGLYGDDTSMSGADGYADASGQSVMNTMSEPYIVQYANTVTTGGGTAVFMGYNDYFGTGGTFGTTGSISVTNLQGGSYGRLLAQSQNKPFHIQKWRFQAASAMAVSNVTSQLAVTITINYVDGNGNLTTKPFNMSVLKDLYQQVTDAIDCTKPINFDGNTFLTIPILAGCTLTMSAYPTMILSDKSVLNGGNKAVISRAPRLSGKNVAPVIIQTTQDVRGITKG